MTDEERKKLCDKLQSPIFFPGLATETAKLAADEIERLAEDVEYWKMIANRAYIDPKPLAQSDAEPAQPQTLRDAAENLLIAIGMGWDIEGCIENLRAALTQSDAEPAAWQLVPKEPTAEMCDAGREFFPDSMDKDDVYARPVWQAMLAAAPAPPRPDASAGMSWAGFNVYGDKKSIDAVRDALHAKDRCDALDKLISEKQLIRPDASAGLIEAAEIAEIYALEHRDEDPIGAKAVRDFADYLRLSAADRGGTKP